MQQKEQLIKKLFLNQCSKKELITLFEMIQKDNSETAPEVMMELFQQMGKMPDLEAQTSERILNRVMLATSKDTPEAKVIPLKSSDRTFFMEKIAVAVLILIAASWFIIQSFNPSQLVVQTAYGEIKEFPLPDGSTVTLNGNSSIHYPTDWSEGETRTVKLQGEAYFKVEKKPSTNAKFQVITNDLIVEVLGTAFNVNTRQETTKVFLEEGKVKLNLEDKKASELYLKPGEVMAYSAKTKLLVSPQKTINDLQISWKKGILIFKDTPLKAILEKLAATNNFEFEVESAELAERKFSLSIPSDNIELAMSILAKTMSTNIVREGNKFIIQDK